MTHSLAVAGRNAWLRVRMPKTPDHEGVPLPHSKASPPGRSPRPQDVRARLTQGHQVMLVCTEDYVCPGMGREIPCQFQCLATL